MRGQSEQAVGKLSSMWQETGDINLELLPTNFYFYFTFFFIFINHDNIMKSKATVKESYRYWTDVAVASTRNVANNHWLHRKTAAAIRYKPNQS